MSEETKKFTEEEIQEVKSAHAKGFLAFSTVSAGLSDEDAVGRLKQANKDADEKVAPVLEKRAGVLEEMRTGIKEALAK